MISKKFERTLNTALQEAQHRHHEYVGSEHLLYALLQEKDVSDAILDCGGDVDRLQNDLEEFLQTYPETLPEVWPEWHCPTHGTALEDQGDILVCSNAHIFPRRNGIPRFVTNSSYTGAFGTQWKKYRLTQLDSYSGSTVTRDRARRCIGEAMWSELEGKQVLECGCGAGRFTEILLAQRASVTSIDLSEAVDANRENFPQSETHRIAQADILRLPFAPQQFDLVLCLGVIQHTPNPEETIACLYDQVKPGGALVIDHYTYNFSWYTKSAPLFRRYLRRLPPEKGMKATEWLVNIFWPLHRMTRHFYPAQMLLSRISPVLCYYSAYPDLGDELLREWALLDTHDSLTDWYKHFRTRGQVRRPLENLGLQEIWSHYGGNGVEARGKRPLLLHSQNSVELQQPEHIFELVNDSVMTRSMEGRINFWNHSAEKLYGWRKEEAIGRVSHDLLQTRFPKPLEEIESDLVRNGRWEGELVHTTREGDRVVVESRWSMELKGQLGALVEINTRSADPVAYTKETMTNRQHSMEYMRLSRNY